MKIALLAAVSLVLAGCATTKTVEVKTEPVKLKIAKPPQPRPVELDNVKWMVVTKDNLQEFIDKQTKSQSSDNPVFIAITVNDYKKLSLNLSELKRYIAQQKSIIVYYEKAVSD